MKKKAILTIAPELLRELLHFPEQATLIDIRVPFDAPGNLELKVEGIGWDTPDGAIIMKAPVAEFKLVGEFIEIDWKVPNVNQS